MRAPTKQIERLIRERVPEATDWLDAEQARSKARGYCSRCGHRAMYHGYSEPDINVYDAACQEAECECEEYVQPGGSR